ncbi:YEATS domain-containing protein 2-like [Babylonia areolata]|uniref:YEATS domain-containing protein 2-like n=1 Tax=Babylonia areolata TaxID=304850 RepID=UPI003FD07D18
MDQESTVSLKRSGGHLDPDYEDLVDQQAKRQRFVEKDACQASVDTIRRIVKTHFNMELLHKETEAKEADRNLNEARAMMDRLRAVIIANFYSNQNNQHGKKTSEDAVPSIHPTAKKHLGKAPVGVEVNLEQSDPPSKQSSRPSTSSSAAKPVTASIKKNDASLPSTSTQSRAASTVSAAAATAPSSQASLPTGLGQSQVTGEEEEQGSSRFSTKRSIVVGNCSRFLLPHQRQSSNPSTHKWMVYVRGPRDKPDISDIVSKVWFFLHPSYRPFDLVEIKEPPFHLSRQGWGEFPVRVQLHFHDSRNKRVDIIHNLVLDKTYTGLQTLGAETVVSMDLVRDPVPGVRPRRPAPSTSSDQVGVKTSAKQEPMDINVSCDEVPQSCRCGDSGSRTCVCGKQRGGGVKACQQTPENGKVRDADRFDMNITIKEEPPDCGQDTAARCHRNLNQSELSIKQEPGEAAETDRCCVSGQQTSKNSRDGIQNFLAVSKQTLNNCPTAVNGDMGRTDSAETRENGEQTDRSSVADTCQLTHVANFDAKLSVQKYYSLLQAAETKLNNREALETNPAQRTTASQALKGAPLKKGDSVSVGQVCVMNAALSQTAVSVAPPGHVSLLKSVLPEKLGDSVSVSAVQPQRAADRASGSVLKLTQPQAAVKGASTSSGATQAVRMVVVKPGHPPAPHQGRAVSLLTGFRGPNPGTPAVATSVVPAAMPVMKVTAQGLKPVVQKMPLSSPAPLTLAKGQPVGQHAASLTVQGRSQAAVPTVIMKQKQTVQKGVTSLLKTAAKPGIQMLLQKSSVLPASSVGQNVQSLLTSSTVSSLPPSSQSSVPASVLSGTSATLRADTLTASPSVSGMSNPYIVAQIKNKKVLMKVDPKLSAGDISSGVNQPACHAQENTSTSFAGTSSESSGGTKIPLTIKFDLQTGTVHSAEASSLPRVAPFPAALHRQNTPAPGTSIPNLSGNRPLTGREELARAKAALQSKAVLSKSAAQVRHLKAATHNKPNTPLDLPCPKPRCGQWFSQGLGSCLAMGAVSEQVENSGAKSVTPGAVAMKGGSEEAEEGVREKRIVVVKKKTNTGFDLTHMGTPVARLSLKEYSSMDSLIKAATQRHPLLAPVSEKTVHPYSAVSMEQWLRWHPAKRNACEWSRAAAVRKYLQLYLEGPTYHGETLWSTKRIMQWCRRCGLSPNGPGGRPLVSLEPGPEQCTVPEVDRKLVSVTDFEGLYSAFDCQDIRKDCEEVEVEILAVEPSSKQQTAVKEEEEEVKVGYDLQFDCLPRTVEAEFVQDTAAQVGVKFLPAILSPGVFSSTAEDMLFGAMMEFASDLIHQACFVASSSAHTNSSHGGPSVTVTSREVLQAVKTRPSLTFLGHQYCGVPNPPVSPVKR